VRRKNRSLITLGKYDLTLPILRPVQLSLFYVLENRHALAVSAMRDRGGVNPNICFFYACEVNHIVSCSLNIINDL
jgi:hypothetical protein